MIVVLTSNYDAGILQFAVQMNSELQKMKDEMVLFGPGQSGLSGVGIEVYAR